MNSKQKKPPRRVVPRAHEDEKLSEKISALLKQKGLKGCTSVAVITNQKNLIGSDERKWSGYEAKKFGYPASLYKLYIAAALVEKASLDYYFLSKKVKISAVNVVSEQSDLLCYPYPKLTADMEVSIENLLMLMIIRSDNTAANALIDVLGRPTINTFIRKQDWFGSEVTRKFLPRALEVGKYQKIEQTKTCTLHLAELLMLIDSLKIGGRIMSTKLKAHLQNQQDMSMLAAGLPTFVTFLHKTGWYETEQEGKKIGITGDAGIVESEGVRYYIAVITRLIPEQGRPALADLAAPLHSLIIDHLRELEKKGYR